MNVRKAKLNLECHAKLLEEGQLTLAGDRVAATSYNRELLHVMLTCKGWLHTPQGANATLSTLAAYASGQAAHIVASTTGHGVPTVAQCCALYLWHEVAAQRGPVVALCKPAPTK
jgi:hypothetical protein